MSENYSYLSIDEFDAAYNQLSNLEKSKLARISIYFQNKYELHIEADDLYQEVLSRIYEGSRKVPKDIALVAALARIIQSVANATLHANSNKQQRSETEDLQKLSSKEATCNSLEDSLILREEEAIAEQRVKALFNAFADDEDVTALIHAMANDFKARDIVEKVFEGNQQKYEATRKRLTRRISKFQNAGASS